MDVRDVATQVIDRAYTSPYAMLVEAAADAGTGTMFLGRLGDECGVCGLHFDECEEQVYVTDVGEDDEFVASEPMLACPGARIRAALVELNERMERVRERVVRIRVKRLKQIHSWDPEWEAAGDLVPAPCTATNREDAVNHVKGTTLIVLGNRDKVCDSVRFVVEGDKEDE